MAVPIEGPNMTANVGPPRVLEHVPVIRIEGGLFPVEVLHQRLQKPARRTRRQLGSGSSQNLRSRAHRP